MTKAVGVISAFGDDGGGERSPTTANFKNH